MPHHFYHGRTGRIFNVNPRAIGVVFEKEVRNRKEEKRVHVRVEHIRKSGCREDFLARVKRNEQLVKEAKKTGQKVCLKRQPKKPENEKVVGFNLNELRISTQLPFLEIH